MTGFEYYSKLRVIYGAGKLRDIGKWVAREGGTRVLIRNGRSSASTIVKTVIAELEKEGIACFTYGIVQSNPRLSDIRAAAAFCKENKIDYILGIGGGSVFDASKVTAAAALFDGDVSELKNFRAADRNDGRLFPPALKVGIIVTNPASGAENSAGASVYDDDINMQCSFLNPNAAPTLVILDPELCTTLPPKLMGAACVDIFNHTMERYLGKMKDGIVGTELCEALMRSVVRLSKLLSEDIGNMDLWGELMWASNISHKGILAMGQISDWTCHGLEGAMGRVTDVSHALSLAALTPAWLKVVCEKEPEAIARMGVKVFGVPEKLENPLDTARETVVAYEQFIADLGLSTHLTDLGVSPELIPEILKGVFVRGNTVGTLTPLGEAEIQRVFELAM